MTSDANVETQFRETMRENSRLAQELGAAKHEITLLRSRLRELEVGILLSLLLCLRRTRCSVSCCDIQMNSLARASVAPNQVFTENELVRSRASHRARVTSRTQKSHPVARSRSDELCSMESGDVAAKSDK